METLTSDTFYPELHFQSYNWGSHIWHIPFSNFVIQLKIGKYALKKSIGKGNKKSEVLNNKNQNLSLVMEVLISEIPFSNFVIQLQYPNDDKVMHQLCARKRIYITLHSSPLSQKNSYIYYIEIEI